MKDLYANLGVSRTASQEEIKKAYRQLTKKFHPDRNPGDEAAEEKFKTASSAYEVLSDKDRRALYDEFGDVSLTQGFDANRARAYKQTQRNPWGSDTDTIFGDYGEAQSTSFDDLLSRLFGGGRVNTQNAGRPRARRGQDISGEIDVSFVDALAGTTVPLRVESQDGEAKTLDVKVPQGMPNGGKLRLRGQGGGGTPPGDILLTVRVRAHKQLTRDGTNLRMTLPVTALEAYRGGPIDVPTPWGTVTLKLAAGSQNGQTLRLRSRGIRSATKPAGDMLVTLDVRLPERAGDDRLLSALTELQGSEDPRAAISF